MTTVSTATVKRVRRSSPKIAAPAPVPVIVVKPKPVVAVAAKPVTVKHALRSGYTGTSPVTTSNMSRTAIDWSTFNSLKDAPLTMRDEAALKALRTSYGSKVFERGDLDAGIVRRLLTRGRIQPVSGSEVDLRARMKLTKLGLGK